MESYVKMLVFLATIFSSHTTVKCEEERLTNGFGTGGLPPFLTGAVYIKQEDVNRAAGTTFVGPLCSASSIAEDRGLSSAYCLYNAFEIVNEWNKIDAQRLKIRKSVRVIYAIEAPSITVLGNLMNNFDATDMEITPQNIRFPTGFNYSGQSDLFPKDIAMIKFPIKLRHNHHPNITNDTVVVGDTHPNLFAAGFGAKNCGSGNLQVQISDVSIVECPPNTVKWPEQFCVNLTYNGKYVQESQGDWGGPLYQTSFYGNGQKIYTQFGVLSYQKKANKFGGGCTTAGQPQVATHISSFYNDFISEYQKVAIQPLDDGSGSSLTPANFLQTILTAVDLQKLSFIAQIFNQQAR